MIQIQIKGGLGNQMFQYATARNLSLKYKKGLILNIEYSFNIPKNDTPRKYQLDSFKISPDIKIDKNLSYLGKIILKSIFKIFGEEKQFKIAEFFNKHNLPVFLNGYFQSEKFFVENRKVLLNEFIPKETDFDENKIKIIDTIKKAESVSLHVRRNDYLKPQHAKDYNVCSMEYYNKAINYIKKHTNNPLVCIFSDDPEWVKKEFKIDNVLFADNNLFKDYEQIYLMSLCKHNIIANSSFSWWGAWLNQNPNKIVIGPKQWLISKSSEELDIMPKDWIKI